MILPAPHVEYFLLAPMLIVFSVAVAGVLAEAFLPRRWRYGAQVTLALGGSAVALIAVIVVARSIHGSGHAAVLGAIAVDRATLFLQGTVLLVTIMAVVFMAERSARVSPQRQNTLAVARLLDSIRLPQASAVPGSDAERQAERAGATQTELFPLAMLSVGGMMVFPRPTTC